MVYWNDTLYVMVCVGIVDVLCVVMVHWYAEYIVCCYGTLVYLICCMLWNIGTRDALYDVMT